MQVGLAIAPPTKAGFTAIGATRLRRSCLSNLSFHPSMCSDGATLLRCGNEAQISPHRKQDQGASNERDANGALEAISKSTARKSQPRNTASLTYIFLGANCVGTQSPDA